MTLRAYFEPAEEVGVEGISPLDPQAIKQENHAIAYVEGNALYIEVDGELVFNKDIDYERETLKRHLWLGIAADYEKRKLHHDNDNS